METFRLRIKPLSAFGSSLLGETLFGQLCWTIRYLQGEKRLEQLLEGYLENRPFAVVSDGFPAGKMPLPHFPGYWWSKSEMDPKRLKKVSWIEIKDMKNPVKQWRNMAASAIDGNGDKKEISPGLQTHNSINRKTSTTGEDQFAPFNMPLTYYSNKVEFDIYVLFDAKRISKEEISEAFEAIGKNGFGRDATTGLGKYEIKSFEPVEVERQAETFMTLNGVCLSGLKLKETRDNFYKVRTHFGRHGGMLAQGKNPFKMPVVTTVAGAVFTPETVPTEAFIGRGIANVSKSDPSTIHQGYAIIVGLKVQ